MGSRKSWNRLASSASTALSKEGGEYTSEGDAQLDSWLRVQNPASGLRELDAICALAIRTGFGLVADHLLPANNRLLVWRRVET